jgi:hypothetical protein
MVILCLINQLAVLSLTSLVSMTKFRVVVYESSRIFVEREKTAKMEKRQRLFENRLKLLGIVTLVYAFLIFLLNPLYNRLISRVLELKCHRTGKRCREAIAPLYRLRWAISRLWDDYRPTLGSVFPPNLETIRVLASKTC